jgi:heptosyltransferase-2/heptosyltransferase-3
MADNRFYLYSAIIGMLHSWHRPRDVRRILVYKLDHLGDLLLATPALSALRGRYPDAEITIVVGEWSRVILENNPNVDRIVIYNSPRFTRAPFAVHSARDLERQLTGLRPDLTIGLRDDWGMITRSILSTGWRIERGRAQMKEWFRRRRQGGDKAHELDLIRGVLRQIGIEIPESARPEFYPSDRERKEGVAFLQKHGIEPPFALVQAGATTVFKEWPLERFAEVTRRLAMEHRLRPVLIGAPGERERSGGLAALVADLDPVDNTGELDLRALGAVMEHAAFYIGADGGSMHLATAMDVPTLALFGPGYYPVFAPVGARVAAISKRFACSPCDQTICVRPDDNCMQAITVDEVITETDLLVAMAGERR